MKWLKSHLNHSIVIFALLSLLMILYVDVQSFRHYRSELYEQEQQQLLMMAQTVGKHLEDAVKQELKGIELYFYAADAGKMDTKEERERAVRYYFEENREEFQGISIWNYESGELEYAGIGDGSMEDLAIQKAGEQKAEQGSVQILGKEMAGSGWYEMLLRYRLRNTPYDILFSMNLNHFYENIVSPVKIGDEGYSVVKDENLAIIMHHAKSQIGMDAVYDREERYPDLDLSSLSAWLDLQERAENGTGILDSYVWDSENLDAVQRLVAFTKIHFQGETWIVNSTLPVRELSEPLRSMIFIIAVFSGIFFLILLVLVAMYSGSQIRTKAQQREIQYLKELNQGMELISKQREEIRHYQRVQSLGMMASHIAHEFNNFLTPVLVYSELLEGDESISEENRELLHEISDSVNRASKLSHDLLAFARQDAGSRLKILDISEELRSSAEVLKQLCPKAVSMETELSEEEIPVLGREGMLQHILMNLCKNAFQAMEKTEEKKLSISLKRMGEYAVLRVRDTGCGISEEAQKRIFEPFYTTKGSKQGTGLGLSVIQNIMNSVNGRIELKSKPGFGTEFLLYFPVKEKEEPDRLLHIRNIAIVSSGEEMMQKVKGWNREHGKYRITLFLSAAALISSLEKDKNSFDMVLSEYQLTEMTGIELLEIVHRLNDKIRRILCTKEKAGDMEWYVNNGIVDRILPLSEFEEVLKN